MINKQTNKHALLAVLVGSLVFTSVDAGANELGNLAKVGLGLASLGLGWYLIDDMKNDFNSQGESKGVTVGRAVGLTVLVPAVAAALTGDLKFAAKTFGTTVAALGAVIVTDCVVPHGKRTFWVNASQFAQYQVYKMALDAVGVPVLDITK